MYMYVYVVFGELHCIYEIVNLNCLEFITSIHKKSIQNGELTGGQRKKILFLLVAPGYATTSSMFSSMLNNSIQQGWAQNAKS